MSRTKRQTWFLFIISQLPTWYELWWDNGFYPGQPVADFMIGAWPSNLTEVGWASCLGLVALRGCYWPAGLSQCTGLLFEVLGGIRPGARGAILLRPQLHGRTPHAVCELCVQRVCLGMKAVR